MPAPQPLVLSIRSLRKDRALGEKERYSLRVPELDVRRGEKLLITGPSGAGKSTLLDMLGMVLRPDEADVFLFFPEAQSAREGAESLAGAADEGCPAGLRKPEARNLALAWSLQDLESLTLWRRHIGYVLQTGGLLPFLSVRENILTPLKLLGRGTPPEYTAVTSRLAGELGIAPLLGKFPAQLSVGERQRAAIARALAAEPVLLLADEPTAALDPHNAAVVLALFSRMAAESGAALIMVTHAPEHTEGMGFRRLELRPAVTPAEQDAGQGAVMELHPAGGS